MSTKFQHSPSRIVAQAIINRSLGTDPSPWLTWTPDNQAPAPNSPWPVFVGSESAFPDNTITVYEAEPQVDAKIHLTGEIVTHWGITVRIRGVDHDTCWAKGEDIRWDFNEALANQDVTISGVKYLLWCLPKVTPVRPILESPTSKRWFRNLNCLAVITPYPLS